MHENPDTASRRILVADDNRAIHDDFRKIFEPNSASANVLAESEAALFGQSPEPVRQLRFAADFATQGEEGAALVGRARAQNKPYALAFVDMRMPGLERHRNHRANLGTGPSGPDCDLHRIFRPLVGGHAQEARTHGPARHLEKAVRQH
jgi:CheY-like chemotaxis protein